MIDARRLEEWDRASAIVAMVHNAAAGQRKPKKPEAFNPYRVGPRVRLSAKELGELMQGGDDAKRG